MGIFCAGCLLILWIIGSIIEIDDKKLFSNLYFSDIMERYGVWRSLVARSAGGREVAGSNPVTPISWRDMLPPLQVLAKWWEHVTCFIGKVFQNWLMFVL